LAYIFMDESGDLGFDFEKKGTTQYFLITFLFADNKRPIEKCVKRVHVGLRQKYRKKIGVLHAYAEEPITRKRLLSCLSMKDLRVMAILLNKRKVYTQLQNEKPVLYNYVTNILLDRVFSRSILTTKNPVRIIASRKDTSRFLNDNFKSYLRSQLAENHNIKLSVTINTPAEQKALQAADFVSWAIFRKYEYDDTSYYNIIKKKIVEEKPLFP
jgi:arsenate reductase-like glutaredoxin family protein